MTIAALYGPEDFGSVAHQQARRRGPRPPSPNAARALPMPSLEWTDEVERATAHLYERVQARDLAGRVAADGAVHQGDQRAEARARRGHPRAQLPDAGDLPLRRRCRRRLAGARHRSQQGEGRHHRAMRRALHGGDVEDHQSGEDGADPGFAGRLLACLQHHRRRRAAAAPAISRRAGGRLCQHLGRGEGRGRHLLHLVERGRGGGEPRRADRDLRAGPISGALCRLEDAREDHRLERRLRGARALHRRRACAPIAKPIPPCRSSRIRNVRPTCWRKPISPARPRT